MTTEPIPEEDDEEEIDPVEAVSRAVNSVDRNEFDDGHELKQLIKNENGVTLPDAGKFLLKALRSNDPPIRRDGDTFVAVDGSGGGSAGTGSDADGEDDVHEDDGVTGDETEDTAGSEGASDTEDTHEHDESRDDVPEPLRKRDVWAVRGTDGTVTGGLKYDEAVKGATGDAEIGYYDALTIDLVGCFDGDELDDRVPEPPLDGAYVERLSDGDGWRVPVVDYEEPDWWSDVRNDGGDVAIKVSTDGFRVSTREAAKVSGNRSGATVKSGGREVDEWLVDILRATGEALFGTEPPEDAPEVNEASLPDDRVKEALEYVDPDLPYPEWRRIGAALVDNYAGTEEGARKAEQVFEEWSRRGSMYDDEAAGHVRDLGDVYEDGYEDFDVGYLVHKACLEGWVWEADGDGDSGEEYSEDEEGVSSVKKEGDRVTKGGPDRKDECDVRVERSIGDRRKPELVERDGGYGYEARGGGFDRVSNFTLETRRRIKTSDGERLVELTVIPENEEGYRTTVEPTVFNSVERFKNEVVTGFTTWFDGDARTLGEIRERVGGEGRKIEGVDFVGLCPESGEFVTPVGTLDGDGWTEKPEIVFVGKDRGVPNRWTPDAEGWDREDVTETVERFPELHGSGEFLTVLGWFYAAPLKPFVVERSGYFPSLRIAGDVEAAKPKLRLVLRAFGTDGEPFQPESQASVLDALSGSRSVPVWFDERQPSSDVSFGNLLDKTARCAEATADGHTRSLTAPVVHTRGGTASKRSIQVEFKQDGYEGVRESYAELAGRSYYDEGSLRCPEAVELGAHATAYYSWIAEKANDEMEQIWDDCLHSAGEVLRSRDTDDTAGIHEVRVTLFGLKLYQRFAEEKGAEPDINAKRRRTEKVASPSSDD